MAGTQVRRWEAASGVAPPLVTFAGFGQSGRVWEEWQSAHRTLYAWDAWGRTDAPAPPNAAHLRQVLSDFLRREGIGSFALAGFSLGCRPALLAAALFPERVVSLNLLAPEVLRPHPAFRVATRFTPGRRAFERVMAHPTLVPYVVKRLPAAYRTLAARQVSTAARRQRVVDTWRIYGRWQPDPKQVAAGLSAHRTPVTVWTGREDAVARAGAARAWLRRVEGGQLIELPTGHGGLIRAAAAHLASARSEEA
ncbi:MAG: alpha/beta fold hydrolase [Catalinimonas sp.]